MATKESKFYVRPQEDKWALEHEDKTRLNVLYDTHAEAVSEGKRIAQVEANIRISGSKDNEIGKPGWVDEETRVDAVVLSIAPESGGGAPKEEKFLRQDQAELDKQAKAHNAEIQEGAAEAAKAPTEGVGATETPETAGSGKSGG